MGHAKQVLFLEGEPLVMRAARAAGEAGCDRVIVVVGAYADAVRSAVEQCRVTIVENARWAEGLASSLRAGLAAAADADAALLLLADQPCVDAAVLRQLRVVFENGDRAAVACTYSGVTGPPAIFRRSLFGELAALEGDEGARRVLARNPARVAFVDFPLGAVDVDTPEDAAGLPAAAKLFSRPRDLSGRRVFLKA
jgi:molybdenum cofactor cytidylyltransferase